MTISEHERLASAFSVAVQHGSSATAVVASDGRALTLEGLLRGRRHVLFSLGVVCNGEALDGSSRLTASATVAIVEQYRAFVGKATGTRTVDHTETTLTFAAPSGREWKLIVRAAADGFAFRYELPRDAETLALGEELTRIHLEPAGRLWTLEYQTWYETVRFGSDADTLLPGGYGFPTLIHQSADAWVLLSESDIDGRSSGAHLVRDAGAPAGELRVQPADVPLEVAQGHRTPWRVAIAGSLSDIVASDLVDDLAPAADPSVPVVARPGRAAWSWWSSQYSGAYLEDQKRFADFAADQGWEHVLVDCGWDAAWVPDLVEHSGRRGVQVHLWSSWSDLDGPEALRSLALWKSWGVAGIKVDFMESESRDRYRWYDAIIAEAERVGLMLNFHGSVIPRGWARTHPNVMSYEGIRGAEYYVFYGDPLTAAHNVIQPFTRNVVGSMDYTPVAFSAPGRETSDAHELALGVVFESGITHFADAPEQYRSRPLAARFLAALPPSWEEVRLLSGHPDQGAVIARRSADRWCVGAITAGDATTITFDPRELLPEGSGWIVEDDPAGGLRERAFDAADGPLEIRVAPNGGFAAVVAAPGTVIEPARPRPTEPPVLVEPRAAVARAGDAVEIVAEEDSDIVAPPGWEVEPTGPGRWLIHVPRVARDGAVGVVTALRPTAETPVAGHARIAVALTPGRHDVTALDYAGARNALGPVEKDQSNGGGDPNDGRPMSVGGEPHPHGLGVTDDSALRYLLGGADGTFTTRVGIDDETPAASARALVVLDGTVAAETLVRSGEPPAEITVGLAQSSVLELRTEKDPASAARGHVDWIEPHITIGD